MQRATMPHSVVIFIGAVFTTIKYAPVYVALRAERLR